MLLVTLLTLTLAVAVVTPLATLSGIEAVTSTYGAATLRHRMAAESVVALLPELLWHDDRLKRDLDRLNRASFSLGVGEVQVSVLLQDDTAKLPLPLIFESRRARVPETLGSLQGDVGLPALDLLRESSGPNGERRSGLRWNGCLDDLFAEPTDAALFGTPDSPRAWAQYIAPLGKTVHVYRADQAVLEASLADLQTGLGQRVAELRGTQSKADVDDILADLELPERVSREARRRLTTHTERYSLLIRTTLNNDVRQRYLICGDETPPRVLVNWEVAP